MKTDPAQQWPALQPLLSDPNFLRATFAGTPRNHSSCTRVTLRTVEIQGERLLQISRFDGKKDLTHNTPFQFAHASLEEVLAAGFANIHIDLRDEQIELRLSKKGQLHTTRRKRQQPLETEPQPHNRPKSTPLPESNDPLLRALGMLDRAGNIRPTARDKFTQINEFLKLLDHALPDAFPEPLDRPLEILDCGCGSSHLTLAATHFLTHIKKIPANLTGIDINEEVLTKARERAQSLQCDITFRQGKIGELVNHPADIVLALHACDTATDDALAQAVRSHAQLILAVPCCHKNLNATLHIPQLAPIHHHGILHQRLADLLTDTFRALLLKTQGYRAEVIEFISPEHTARNLMIRAVKKRATPDPAALEEYQALKIFTGATPHLEQLLKLTT